MDRQKNTRERSNVGGWLDWFDPKPWEPGAPNALGLSNGALFLILAGIAFAIRCIVLVQLSGNHPAFDQPIVDSRWHYLWAKQIASGDWLGHDVYFRAPFYPYFLGVWIKLFGDGLWPIRLVQALLGGVTAGLTFLIGAKTFGRRVGIIAGLLTAFYGTLIYYETELLVEVIAVPLGLWAIYLAISEASQPTPRPGRWFGIGALLGLFAITRPNILLVVPAFWWWAWISGRGVGASTILARMRSPLVLTLGLLLPILPVTARNYVVAKDAVLISYQGGINLWLGNNPSSDGLTMIMPEITLDESVEWTEFVNTTDSLASSLAGRELRASEVSSFWTGRALTWIVDHPAEALGGWLKKTWYFLGGYEVSDQTDIQAYSSYSWLLDILISRPILYIPFGIIAPFGCLGLVLAWRRSSSVRPLIGFVVLYALTVVLFLATARHRLPVVPIFIVCAAAALIHFVRGIRLRQFKALVIPLLAVVGLAIALNQRTTERIMTNPAFLHYQLALAEEQKGDYESAAMEYEQAIAAEPNHLASRKNLAYALVRMGSYDSAVAVSFSYLRHRQQDAEAYNNLGLAYLGLGDTTKAEGSFRVAIRNNPNLPHPRFNMGEIAAARKNLAAAVIHFQDAIKGDSTFTSAYNSLAIIYAGAANAADAELLLKTGLRHVPDHAILLANLGSLYVSTGKPQQAIEPLERSLRWQPQATAVRINLAVAYLKMEKLTEAEAQLRKVLEQDPSNGTAKMLVEKIESMRETL